MCGYNGISLLLTYAVAINGINILVVRFFVGCDDDDEGGYEWRKEEII